MSGSSRPALGFTLLELLVVLVILAMAASFVAPNLWQTYSKARERGAIQDAVVALQAMRLESYHQGRVIRLGGSPPAEEATPFPPLPPGWRMEPPVTPLYFLPTGATNGGRIGLLSPSNREWLLILRPLDGEPEIRQL